MDTNTQASWHVAYHRKSLATDFSSLIDSPSETIILCFSPCTSSQSRATLNWPSVEHHSGTTDIIRSTSIPRIVPDFIFQIEFEAVMIPLQYLAVISRSAK